MITLYGENPDEQGGAWRLAKIRLWFTAAHAWHLCLLRDKRPNGNWLISAEISREGR